MLQTNKQKKTPSLHHSRPPFPAQSFCRGFFFHLLFSSLLLLGMFAPSSDATVHISVPPICDSSASTDMKFIKGWNTQSRQCRHKRKEFQIENNRPAHANGQQLTPGNPFVFADAWPR
ncbi:hypothetical protein LZ31DRAFT_146340 [Colletotrichum somersetense]|nr:hypothetical protein LZ31DRAFT_146340 [Colletotrichum somersetense]